MTRPKLLDLFCGAGGASVGYARAGFDVVGVDIRPQPHYPFTFYQGDAMTFPLDGFDAIHASPPCQRFSKSVSIAHRLTHPDFIAATRFRLVMSGVPYVIENVPRAPLLDPVTLCGSMFDGLRVIRHRKFEGLAFDPPGPCDHERWPADLPMAWNRTNPLRAYAVSGGWQDVPFEEIERAMGIDWMTPSELSESIPPAYTEWIGRYLLAAVPKRATA